MQSFRPFEQIRPRRHEIVMTITIWNNNNPDDDGDEFVAPAPAAKNLSAGAERGAGPPLPRFSEPFWTCGWTANCGTWGSSGHCAETCLPGFTHAGERGAPQGAAGLCRAGGAPPGRLPRAPPRAGKGGAGQGAGRAAGPPRESAQGVSILGGPRLGWAGAAGKIAPAPQLEVRKAFSHPRAGVSPPWSCCGWGGAAPLCGPAGLQPAFLQSRRAPGCRAPGVMHMGGGGGCGAGKGALGLQTLSQSPLPAKSRSPRSSQLCAEGGAGAGLPGATEASPLPRTSPQDPAPPCPPSPGPPSAELGGTVGARPGGGGRRETEALDAESHLGCVSTVCRANLGWTYENCRYLACLTYKTDISRGSI